MLTKEQQQLLDHLKQLLGDHVSQRVTTDEVRHAIRQCQRAGIPGVTIDGVLLDEMTKQMAAKIKK